MPNINFEGDIFGHFHSINKTKLMVSFSEKVFNFLQRIDDENNLSEDVEDCGWPYECHFCCAIYFLKSGYENHIKSHEKIILIEKTNICTFNDCNRAFLRKSDLKKHQVQQD